MNNKWSPMCPTESCKSFDVVRLGRKGLAINYVCRSDGTEFTLEVGKHV